ncbi:transposase [Streptomyces decoyicus]
MRAHQQGAGAREAPPAAVAQKGAWQGANQADPVLRKLAGRPAGGGGQIGECLGRSRGGFTTRIHLVAEGRCRPLTLVLTPAHYGDGPQLERVLEQVFVPRTGVGRPSTRPDRVLADKSYTSRRNRRYLRRRGIRHTIPERLDQQKPPQPRLPRRSSHRLRQRALQEAQHRRTHHQPAEGLPCRRHPLRKARIHLPRHRRARASHDLASHMIRETVPKGCPVNDSQLDLYVVGPGLACAEQDGEPVAWRVPVA